MISSGENKMGMNDYEADNSDETDIVEPGEDLFTVSRIKN